MVLERVDLAPRELGCQALCVPVRQEADDDDRLLDPRRQPLRPGSGRSGDERLETAGRAADTPAVEARPARAEGQRGCDALLAGNPHATGTQAEPREIGTSHRSRRPATAGRQEEEARAFLVGVAEEPAVRVSAVLDRELVHPATLGRAVEPCLTNPGNYT